MQQFLGWFRTWRECYVSPNTLYTKKLGWQASVTDSVTSRVLSDLPRDSQSRMSPTCDHHVIDMYRFLPSESHSVNESKN